MKKFVKNLEYAPITIYGFCLGIDFLYETHIVLLVSFSITRKGRATKPYP